MKLTTEEAILRLRDDPRWAPSMRDSYLDADVAGAARRFEASGEFIATRDLLGERLRGATVLDLGAGTGIASRALAAAGAVCVVALEPDPSPVVGQGAIRVACADVGGVCVVGGTGESLPFRDAAFDVVYARQVLHHARDLRTLVAECRRVLRPGGVLLVCREHVVDDERQLRAFLEEHPVHQLAGGEHAFSLPTYLDAFASARLEVRAVLGPWSSVINAFPAVRSDAELGGHARRDFVARWGPLGRIALLLPGMERVARRQRDRPVPGRLFSFVCGR